MHRNRGLLRGLRQLTYLVLSVVCPFDGNALVVSAATQFRPAYVPPPRLDPAGIHPRGEKFGIGLYTIVGQSKVDPTVSNMQRAAEAGFTLAGPYYSANWQDFSAIYAAAREGIRFTYQIRPHAAILDVPIQQRAAAIQELSDEAIAASVREQVSKVLSDPVANRAVARWTLGVEEIRHWLAPEMRYLRIARETIRAVEKEHRSPHRPFWMYEPNHRNVEALLKTGVYQDIVSKGVYLTNLARGPQRSAHAMWSFTQIVSAANALHTLPQAVLQLSEDFADPITGTNPLEIRRVLRHDTYLGLLLGIKSFNVWSMFENRPNLTTHREQFEAYASVSKELTGDLNLQQVFLSGQRRDDLAIAITQGATTFDYTDFYGQQFTYDSLHSYSASVGSDRYLFLVNSSEAEMGVRIDGLPTGFLLDDLFAGTTRQMHQSQLSWQLDVLGVAALRFRDLSAPQQPGANMFAVPEPSAIVLADLVVILWATLCRRRKGQRRRTTGGP
jgi:hypothetical protein